MRNRKIAAWLVHLYTASGGIVGMFALFAAAENQIRLAFVLLLITAMIDATDGFLARKVRVRQVLPYFDGSMMDNIIDVLTYIWVPIFIIGRLDVLPHILWIVPPLLAGMYAYGQTNMKTDDNYFLGFPSYWNVIAIYIYWLQPQPIWAVLMTLIPAILTFVPTHYLYLSRNQMFARPQWIMGTLWFVLCLYLLLQEQTDHSTGVGKCHLPIFLCSHQLLCRVADSTGKIAGNTIASHV